MVAVVLVLLVIVYNFIRCSVRVEMLLALESGIHTSAVKVSKCLLSPVNLFARL